MQNESGSHQGDENRDESQIKQAPEDSQTTKKIPKAEGDQAGATKMVGFFLNGNRQCMKKVCLADSLDDVRLLLAPSLRCNFSFFLDGFKLPGEDEAELTVEDILVNGNQVHLVDDTPAPQIPPSMAGTIRTAVPGLNGTQQQNGQSVRQSPMLISTGPGQAGVPSFGHGPLPGQLPQGVPQQPGFFPGPGQPVNGFPNQPQFFPPPVNGMTGQSVQSLDDSYNFGPAQPPPRESREALWNQKQREKAPSPPPEPAPKAPVKSEPISGAIDCGLNKKGMRIFRYPKVLLKQDPSQPNIPYLSIVERESAKYITVLGETGVGKSTQLNSLVNYLLGVQHEDDFRYEIVDEAINLDQTQSQTSKVTIYCMKAHNGHPPMVIMDTPGYADTRGLDKDKEIDDMLQNLFTKEVDRVHLICFVAKSSSNRLTPIQTYVFNKVLHIFGKDVAENFVFLLTFCDGGEPQVVESLTSDNNPVIAKIIPKIKAPWYLQFNNSVVFEKPNPANFMSKMFWDLSMKSMEGFTVKLGNMNEKSLVLTQEVIKERKRLDVIIYDLQNQLKLMMDIKLSLEKTLVQLEIDKELIEKSKNYTIEIEEPYLEEIKTKPGEYTTYCKYCQMTCHEVCNIPPGEIKKGCDAMDSLGNCEVCPQHCSFEQHDNWDYIYKRGTRVKVETLRDLEKMFCDASSNKSKGEQIIDGMAQKIEETSLKCIDIQEVLRESINRLSQIAMLPSVFATTDEYLDMMIANEEAAKEKGWDQRRKALLDLKERNKKIDELLKMDVTKKKSKAEILKELMDEEEKKVGKKKPKGKGKKGGKGSGMMGVLGMLGFD